MTSPEAQMGMLNEFASMSNKVFKLAQLYSKPADIDVGTTPADVVFEYNKMRLLRYRPLAKKRCKTPLLLVYANINKPYILDLQPDRSVVRRLLEGGIDVYLIDWGTATDADMYTTIDDYVNYYIRYAVDFVMKDSGQDKISLMGYCIGGFLTTIFASLYPEKIRNLIIMAAPVNFDTDKGPLHIWTRKEYFDPGKVVRAYNNCPPDLLNGGFLLLNPVENMHLKYLKLLDNIDNEEFVKNFLRMEKWTFDGVAVPGRFYEEYIRKGYQENQLIRSELLVGNRKVNLKNINMPLLVLVGTNDNLTPPDATTPLIDEVSSKDKTIMENVSGHIGISVGGRAHRELWPKVAEWLGKRSGNGKVK